jgi:hypothetical protein
MTAGRSAGVEVHDLQIRTLRPPPWGELEPLIAESEREGFRLLARLRREHGPVRAGAARGTHPPRVRRAVAPAARQGAQARGGAGRGGASALPRAHAGHGHGGRRPGSTKRSASRWWRGIRTTRIARGSPDRRDAASVHVAIGSRGCSARRADPHPSTASGSCGAPAPAVDMPSSDTSTSSSGLGMVPRPSSRSNSLTITR